MSLTWECHLNQYMLNNNNNTRRDAWHWRAIAWWALTEGCRRCQLAAVAAAESPATGCSRSPRRPRSDTQSATTCCASPGASDRVPAPQLPAPPSASSSVHHNKTQCQHHQRVKSDLPFSFKTQNSYMLENSQSGGCICGIMLFAFSSKSESGYNTGYNTGNCFRLSRVPQRTPKWNLWRCWKADFFAGQMPFLSPNRYSVKALNR